MDIVLYTKSDCPLCDRLERMVQPYLASIRATLVKCDVSQKPMAERLYRHRIPVLTCNGRSILEGRPLPEQVARIMTNLISHV